MQSRIFTISERTEGETTAQIVAEYKGFDKIVNSETDTIAVVRCDGDLELFSLDAAEGQPASELLRYLSEQEVGDVRILGVFKRIK